MVRLEGNSFNALFDVLEDWNETLRPAEFELWGAST